MENIVANLSGKSRRQNIGGREFLIAPLTLIVPGVLAGSHGPLLYPPEEVAKNSSAWNGMPLLANHPSEGSSGRSPSVQQQQGIGTVYHSVIEDGTLKAEGWFDIENTQRVAPDILAALSKGEKIELSTGLFLQTKEAEPGAVFNDVPYDHIVGSIQPDHLAILLDTVGACSIGDGCGVNNKKVPKEGDSKMQLTDIERETMVNSLIKNDCCWDEEDKTVLNDFSDEKLTKLTENAKKEKTLKLVANSATTGFTDVDGNTHVYNEKTDQWDTTKKPTEKKKEETVENKKPEEPKQLTEEEWMKSAPVSVQEDLAFARNEKAKQKKELVAKLVANVKDEQEQARLTTNFMKKSLDDLQDALAILPEVKPTINYAGAASPGQSVENTQENFASFGLPEEYIPDEV